MDITGQTPSTVLLDTSLPSLPGNERRAVELVAGAVRALNIPPVRLEMLKTAVAEAVMNAIEHGNRDRPELPVGIRAVLTGQTLLVAVTDQSGGTPHPTAEAPNIDAKLAGEQTPRGWGFFLIKNMVDDLRVRENDTQHTVELFFRVGGSTGAPAQAGSE